ncbi:MAG: hypothetical protein GXY33_18805 [Phycisphaerae bacterium]|nr:hypothetical protein [Phycisphaerae bacterium]
MTSTSSGDLFPSAAPNSELSLDAPSRMADQPMQGDADLDGDVDLGDFDIFEANFATPSGATWEQGDFDQDDDVDLDDFALLQNSFGYTQPTNGENTPPVQVPAPAAILLGAIGLALAGWVRQRLA